VRYRSTLYLLNYLLTYYQSFFAGMSGVIKRGLVNPGSQDQCDLSSGYFFSVSVSVNLSVKIFYFFNFVVSVIVVTELNSVS